MSRTDKDRPWWLRATWWKPRHLLCPHDNRAYGLGSSRDCDLPDRPVIARDAPRAGGAGIRRTRCAWWPEWEFRCTCDYCRPRFPRNERPANVAYAREAIAEHRATGTVDQEPPRQGRGPRWCDW